MKTLIVPVAIITALVAILAIMDRQGFVHCDTQSVQADKSSISKQSLDSAESRSDGRANPRESSEIMQYPGTDSASAPTAASVVLQNNTEKRIEETLANPIPVAIAIPVAAQDEAEKLNEEALLYAEKEKEKREPFYKLYQGLDKECVVQFQGTIRETSNIPDPTQNDYPDCFYSLFIELDSVLTDNQSSKEIASEAIIIVPIMKEKKTLDSNILIPGNRIICRCAEYEKMPQAVQEIQIADDIQSFDHQQFFVISMDKVTDFRTGGNKDFAKREITILPIRQLPKDENSRRLRKERIHSEIARIENELMEHGGSFSSWKEEYKPIAEKYQKLCEEGYKKWINGSFYAAIEKESTYYTKEYIDWILPYKEYLQKNHIDLIIVRCPSRADFAARVLCADDFQENPAWVEHYYECLKNDIEIVDPMPEMWNKRFDYPLFYFYTSKEERHPFEGEMIIAAEKIAQVLNRYNYNKDRSFALKKTMIDGDKRFCYPEGHPTFSSEDPIEFDGLTKNDELVGLLAKNSGSPFIFLSNSMFGFKEMQEKGMSVPHYTSFFLQSTVDWMYQSGVANPMIRNLISTSTNLDKRSAVIMVGQSSLWKGGPKIPKYLFDDTNKLSFETKYDFRSNNIVISDIDSYQLNQEDDGSLFVCRDKESTNSAPSFSVELPVLCPDRNYKTCMIRVIFKKITGLLFLTVLENEKKIDTASLAVNSDLYADLFVPVGAGKVKIVFTGGPAVTYTVENIELWYY